MTPVFSREANNATLYLRVTSIGRIPLMMILVIWLLILNGCGASLIQVVQERDTARVSEMIEKGVNVNQIDKFGRTPLIIALSNSDLNTARVLLDKGADVNIGDNDGRTPLMLATTNGDTAIMYKILAKGVHVNARTKYGMTVLMIASANGSVEMARALLDNGESPNIKGDYDFKRFSHYPGPHDKGNGVVVFETLPTEYLGTTPLILATAHGHKELVELLLEKGADANKKSDVAGGFRIREGGFAYKEEPRQLGAGPAALMLAYERGDTAIARILIGGGADVSIAIGGKNILTHAIVDGRTDFAEMIIEVGADLQLMSEYCEMYYVSYDSNYNPPPQMGLLSLIQTSEVKGEQAVRGTPLHAASYYGRAPVVRSILEKGGNPNARDEFGRTALMNAAEKGHVEVVRLLIERGADVNAQDYGATGVNTITERSGNVRRVLLTEESKVKTALKYAEEGNFLDIVRILKEAGARE